LGLWSVSGASLRSLDSSLCRGGAKSPFSSENSWRIPSPDRFPLPNFTPGRLNSEEIEVLRSFRAGRGGKWPILI